MEPEKGSRVAVMRHAEVHNQKREQCTQHQLDNRLDNLRNGSWEHIALSLKIAAVNRGNTAEQNGRCKREHRIDGVWRLDEVKCVRKADDHQSDRADQSHHQKERNRKLVYLPDIVIAFLRHALGSHARNDNRQTTRGNNENDAEHLVGIVINAHSHGSKALAEHGIDVGKNHLIEYAEHLDNDHADGQNRRSLDKGLGGILPRARDRVIFF